VVRDLLGDLRGDLPGDLPGDPPADLFGDLPDDLLDDLRDQRVSIWERVRAALTPKPPNLDDRVRLSFDAADVLASNDVVAALFDAAELASFWRAVGVERVAVASTLPAARVKLIAQASVLGAGRDEARCGDLLYALVRVDKNLAAAFANVGVTRAKLTTFLAHGVVEHPPLAAPRGDELDIVLHNDDFTPQDFVVAALQHELAIGERDAIKHMLEVHTQGASVVGTLPRVDAIDAATRLRKRAIAAGFPLLVTIESLVDG
jgi:ATP-dependent Clp protease adaptor protein ClpS